MKPILRTGKQSREFRVLLGLVEHYLKTGRPVGSNTLKESDFEELSSATIRNYFAKLEEEGYLIQAHSSGGRIPTPKAYRTYIQENIDSALIPREAVEPLREIRISETREITTLLQKSADTLSSLSKMAVFLSAPRFDHDYIVSLKLVPIDHSRCLCILVTDFGVIKSEVIPTENKISSFAAKRIESYFHWRLTGLDKPRLTDEQEEKLAQQLYNEIMIRYIVNYSNFIDAELYRTGMSKLLQYPEFADVEVLSNALSLFENAHDIHLLVKDCCKHNQLKSWIAEDLAPFSPSIPNCAILAIPYYINQSPAGAIGLMGPLCIPYRELFGLLKGFSANISEALTNNLFKFKITVRYPETAYDHKQLSHQDYRLLLPMDSKNQEVE